MATAVPIDPGKLIEAAWDFANHQGGAGRPRPVWLRQAVSAAYYALYHCITRQAGVHLLPNGTKQEQLGLCRSFDHGSVKEACQWVAGRGGAPPHARGIIARLQRSTVAGVADAFVDLQSQRHRADYDHLASFPKATAASAVRDAEAIAHLTAAPQADREAFFSVLAFKARLR